MKKQSKIIIVIVLLITIVSMYFIKNGISPKKLVENSSLPQESEFEKITKISVEVKSKILNGQEVDKPVFLEFGSSG